MENYLKLTQINKKNRNILRIKTNFQIFGVQEFGGLFPTRVAPDGKDQGIVIPRNITTKC